MTGPIRELLASKLDMKLAYDVTAGVADPLVHHGNTRARNASEYMKVTEWVVANMSKMEFPVISFCSEKDTMCDPDGSKMLIDRSKVSHLT